MSRCYFGKRMATFLATSLTFTMQQPIVPFISSWLDSMAGMRAKLRKHTELSGENSMPVIHFGPLSLDLAG